MSPTDTALRAVLFDYSGVMTTAFGMPEGDAPFDRDAVFVEMAGALTGTDPHPYHDLERGEITMADFLVQAEAAVPGSGALFDPGSEWNVMANLDLRADRVELVRSVAAAGVRVALVTNNVAEWAPLWRPALPDDLFEFVIDSSDVGMRKPNRAIYELALARLGDNIDPAQVLFVDDFEWNVAGAEAVGFQGLHCTADLDLAAAISAAI